MSELKERKPATKVEESVAPREAPASAGSQASDRYMMWMTRLWTTLVMIAAFFAVVAVGHWACVGLILLLEAAMFREMERVRKPKKEAPATSALVDWGLWLVSTYTIVGRVLSITFAEQLDLPYHMLLSFLAYAAVFVGFVFSLRTGFYKQQFMQFAYTHMILMSALLQANFWVHNVFKGLFWLMLPASLVIVNDIMAFVFGSLLGRTPLIALSPKKTWEGWIGGTASTFVWGFFFARALAAFPWLTCPKTDLYSWDVQCTPNHIFLPRQFFIPGTAISFTACPVQFHALVLAAFASLVAPFGGFFASGLKRAFKAKDFDSIIPGHGGLTDRFDCQMLMGAFSNIYVSTFIFRNTVASALYNIGKMDVASQFEIFNRLRAALAAKGLDVA